MIRWLRNQLPIASGAALVLLLAIGAYIAGTPPRLIGISLLAFLLLLFVLTIKIAQRWVIIFFLLALFLRWPGRTFLDIDTVALLVVAVALTMLGRSSRSVENTKRDSVPHLVPLIALTFTVVAILATATQGWGASKSLLPWMCGIFLVIILHFVPSDSLPSVAHVRRAILTAGGLVLAVDMLLLLTGSNVISGDNAGRFTGSTGDYELAAEYYAFMIIVALGSLWLEKGLHAKVFLVTTAVVGVTLLLATQSRSSLLLTVVAVPAIYLIHSLGSARHRARTLIITVLASVATFIVLDQGRVNFATYDRLSRIDTEGSLAQVLNRSGVWTYFDQQVKYRGVPLIGNGFQYDYLSFGTYPHSLYKWLHWSGGTVGLVVFIALVSAVWLTATKVYLAGRDLENLLPPTLLLVLMVDQYKIEVSRTPESILFLFLLLGWTTISYVHPRRPRPSASRTEAVTVNEGA